MLLAIANAKNPEVSLVPVEGSSTRGSGAVVVDSSVGGTVVVVGGVE